MHGEPVTQPGSRKLLGEESRRASSPSHREVHPPPSPERRTHADLLNEDAWGQQRPGSCWELTSPGVHTWAHGAGGVVQGRSTEWGRARGLSQEPGWGGV